MKNSFRKGEKIQIRVSDPWDSNEALIGFFQDQIFIDDLVSILVKSENGDWIALLPKYKGQDLTDILQGKPIVVNIAKLTSNVDLSSKHLLASSIVDYAAGSATIVK
jgi:hypothetical protein